MQNEKVLIVEDDPDARKQLAKFVSKEGFDVVEAEDAKMGLEKVNAERPDIVITDIKMPGGDGFQIIKHLKEILPLSHAILITGFGDTDIALKALDEGVLDYLKKPIDLNVLAEILEMAKNRVSEDRKVNVAPVLLIVEDDLVTLEMLGRMMQKEDWKILKAKNGEEAINFFREKRVDLVVFDYQLPGKNGLTVLKEMRELTKDFEAIMCSGTCDEETVIKALQAGVINFVRKPIDVIQMEIFLQKALEKLNLKRALKYRTRELDFAHNAIKFFVSNKNLLIDFSSLQNDSSSNDIQGLLDSIPVGLVLVNKTMDILYANKPIAALGPMRKFDESLLKGFEKIGFRGLEYAQLMSVMDGLFSKKEGSIENIKIGELVWIAMIKALLIHGENREEAVFMMIRGEKT